MGASKNLEDPVQAAGSNRADWVDMQLIRVFMRDTELALYVSLGATCVIAILLFADVPPLQLGVWVCVQVAFVLARVRIVQTYRQRSHEPGGDSLASFVRRFEWLWPVSAVGWGSLVWLFFLRASTFDQFVCLLILVGVASTSVPSYGARLQSALRFIDVLHATVMAVMLFRLATVTAPVRLPPFNEIAWLSVLVMMHWIMVRIGARRFHGILRSGFKVQFDNTVLISSLTEKSRAALQAVVTKDRFIASAAHDLRQPVHALNLYAGWLESDPQLVGQITPKIVRSTQVLDELFDSLFYFSGLNSEPLRVKLEPVDLEQLLHDMKQQFEASAIQKHLRFYVSPQPGTLLTDPMLLRRLLGNFLTNAFKHTQHGSITLSAAWHKNKWRIDVMDTGPGIAEEHQRAIFEEFYRAPSSGTAEGFGLGLAIVVRLSRALRHRVGLRSSLGMGSVFWVEVNALNAPNSPNTPDGSGDIHTPTHPTGPAESHSAFNGK